MVWTAFFAMVFLTSFIKIPFKFYSNETSHIKNSSNIYAIVTGITAMIVFAILSGGNIVPNLPTIIYAAILAVIVFGRLLVELFAMSRTDLVNIAVFGSAGSILIPFLFGLVFLNESVTYAKILAASLLLIVVILPLLGNRLTKKSSFGGYIGCIVLFILNGAYTILIDIYANAPGGRADSVFCFWANALILPFAILMGIMSSGTKQLISDIREIKLKPYASIVLTVVCSNITTLLGIYILGTMDLSLYSILAPSFGMMLTAIISVAVFKEKLTVSSILAIALSIGAIILNTI